MLVAKLVEAARFLVLAALNASGCLETTFAILLLTGIHMQPHRTSWPARECVVDLRELLRPPHLELPRLFYVSGSLVSLRSVTLVSPYLIMGLPDTIGGPSSTPVLVPKLVEAARFLVLAVLSVCDSLMRTFASLLFFGTFMQPHRTSWPARESVVICCDLFFVVRVVVVVVVYAAFDSLTGHRRPLFAPKAQGV